MSNVKTHTKLALIVGLLLDYIDELNTDNFWSRKVKNIGRRLAKEIKKYDDMSMDGIDKDTAQDFVNGYQSVSNLIDFNLSLSENQLQYFSKDLDQLIKKYESTKTSNATQG